MEKTADSGMSKAKLKAQQPGEQHQRVVMNRKRSLNC